jgi:hypothetical protein
MTLAQQKTYPLTEKMQDRIVPRCALASLRARRLRPP